jgi:hypothetical protein
MRAPLLCSIAMSWAALAAVAQAQTPLSPGVQALVQAPVQAPAQSLRAATLPELTMVGMPSHGLFDASVASGPGGALYMSVSGVEAPGGDALLEHLAVRTLLARSTDQGEHWSLLGAINPDIGFAATEKRKPKPARWQSEVSALAYDPYDAPPARWKLLWHQYLRIEEERQFEHGWIALREAATPEALANATPVKLIGTFAYAAVNNDAAAWTRPPIAGAPVLQASQISSELAGCAVLTEPGVLARPEGLYLALVCHEKKSLLKGVESRIVLLRCMRPCTAAGSWQFVGTVLDMSDAKALGVEKFSAADLFSAEGSDYLTVSPVGKNPGNDAYKGCWVIPFRNINTGELWRSAGGVLQPRLRVTLEADSFNGACSYLPAGPHRGLFIGQLAIDASKRKVPTGVFHLYDSGIGP